jgi:hypothetical protein
MAGVYASVSSGLVSITGGSPQTVLQLIAPTNQRLRVTQYEIMFDGVNSANTPASVQIMRQTAGTFSTSVTPKKRSESSATGETLQATAKTGQTVAATAGDILHDWFAPVFGGFVIVPLPPGQEDMVQGGTILGVLVNPAQTVDVKVTILYEE